MTRTSITLADQAYDVGSVIEVIRPDDHYRLNSARRIRLAPGTPLRITRVFSESIVARTLSPVRVRYAYEHRNEHASFSFHPSQVRILDRDAPPPRRLGRTPDRATLDLPDDVEVIGTDHPGIQWLWEDLADFATEQGYCSQFDALAAKLGLPGRPRDFVVNHRVGDINITSTVKARSQAEANRLVLAALNGLPAQGPDETESGTI